MKLIDRLILTIAGLVLCSTAAAEGTWYAGVSLGSGEANEIGFADIDDGSALTGSIDDSDFGWKLFGGHTYNEFVSIELAYVDLGEVSIDAVSDGGGISFDAGQVFASVATTGFSLSVVGSMPVNDRFDLHAKVGYFAWEAEERLSNSAFTPVSAKLDGADPTFGIGATYEINERFAVRGEYEIFADIDTFDGSLFSLGLTAIF